MVMLVVFQERWNLSIYFYVIEVWTIFSYINIWISIFKDNIKERFLRNLKHCCRWYIKVTWVNHYKYSSDIVDHYYLRLSSLFVAAHCNCNDNKNHILCRILLIISFHTATSQSRCFPEPQYHFSKLFLTR